MKLFDYQELGVRFLASRRRAYLADVPGLGKTAQAIRAIEVISEGGVCPDVLVVCPAVAVPVWTSEWAKWTTFEPPTIVSYSKLARIGPGSPLEKPYDLVILDEAHYAKSPDALRTKAALRVAERAGRAWLLSGSPMPNDPSELFTVFEYLWPERMPTHIQTFEGWRDHFCRWFPVQITKYRTVPKIVGTHNGAQLRHMVRDIMLRRHVADVDLQLPPLRLHVVPLPSDEDFAGELEELIEMGEIETPTVRRLLGEHKAGRIAKIVGDELISPIVLMYHHKDVGKLLRAKLIVRGWRCYGFDGSHTSGQRGREVERFQNDPAGPKVFIVQQQAGGVAITLTAAAEIVLVEPDWSPEVNAQAIKRVHRIGSERPVRARIFSVEGSLDEGIMEALARKIRMRKEILA